MNKNWYVEVVTDSGDVVERIACDSSSSASRVDRGVNINLNHAAYFTRIVPPAASQGDKP